jgi:hypothetical protein
MRAGTIADATIIAAPSSTKNQQGKRDEQMHHNQPLSACFIALSGMASSFIRPRKAINGISA